ncbi:MAG: prephenate dehydrogenase/arogenate dehydrogenase family protein [bacterium]|nr:prephenate dehydrogenase/arogenate dehydrogenase family protein [bacterium]
MNNTIVTIGVIGYGRFGSFYAEDILPVIFPKAQILKSSRNHTNDQFVSFEKATQCDLIIPAVPIRTMPEVLKKIAHHIKSNSMVMDVCSVKSIPARWMEEYLPEQTQIIASHPMFGKSSYEHVIHDLSRLPLVMHPVRIDQDVYRSIRTAFAAKLKVIDMSPDEHDKKAAQFQFISHLLGGVLHQLDLSRSEIDTQSGSRMFDMIEVLNNDSMELFEDMYTYNPYAKKEMEKFEKAYIAIKKHLQP